jgi:hypothetical protein
MNYVEVCQILSVIHMRDGAAFTPGEINCLDSTKFEKSLPSRMKKKFSCVIFNLVIPRISLS